MPQDSANFPNNGSVTNEVPGALISMRNIWKTYQMGTEQLHALQGVSFEVQKGEYLAIKSEIQITAGLSEGQEVITGPSRVLNTLKEGAIVKRQVKKEGADAAKS